MAAGFVAPYTGTLYISCAGGSAAATSTFGTGTSQANFVPYLTGLPQSCSTTPVSIGKVNAGQTVQFGMSTLWNGQTYWAFSGGTDTGSLVAFTDVCNSLGMGGSILQQTSSSTWVMHLDDAAHYTISSCEANNILIQLTLVATPPALAAQTYALSTSPSDCGTRDQAVVQWSAFPGYSCMRTAIFPQFAIGNGWTTQITGFLPLQPPVSGIAPSVLGQVFPGDFASVTRNIPCAGIWESITGTASQTFSAQVPSGGAYTGNFTGLAGCPSGSQNLSVQIPGLGQGPMQLQIFAPNAQALQNATAQMTQYYQDSTFSWQVTVNPIDVLDAKNSWTAPLYQGGNYTTAFSVVNMSPSPQAVTITLRDDNGNLVTSPLATPILAGGCGCNQDSVNAAGGFFAQTVPAFFSNIGVAQGTIQFTASQPIIVFILRVINNSLGSVPAV